MEQLGTFSVAVLIRILHVQHTNCMRQQGIRILYIIRVCSSLAAQKTWNFYTVYFAPHSSQGAFYSTQNSINNERGYDL